MRNIAYCYVFHRQRAKLGPELVLMPFTSCRGNCKYEAFLQSPALNNPMASPIQNQDTLRNCMLRSGNRQMTGLWGIVRGAPSLACVTARPGGGWMPNLCKEKQQSPRPHPSKAITSVYLNFSPLAFPLQTSSDLKRPPALCIEKGEGKR